MRYTTMLVLCVLSFSFSAIAFAGHEANAVVLPGLYDGLWIEHPDVPLKQLAAALTSHPHARLFRVQYSTMEFMHGLCLRAEYDRKLQMMYLSYAYEGAKGEYVKERWKITGISEAAIGQASEVRPDGFTHNEAYFDTLAKFGGKYHALRR